MNEWPTSSLRDLTTKIGSGATPRGGAAVYTESGVSLIRSQNVLDNSMKTAEIAHITDEAAHALRGVTVQEDDVLINITGDSIARSSVVDPLVLPARVNQHVAIIRTNSLISASYLQRFLVNPEQKARLLAGSDGGTRNALTKTALGDIQVPLPPMQVQLGIAKVLGALDAKLALNSRIIQTTSSLMKARYDQTLEDAPDGTTVVEGMVRRLVQPRKISKLDVSTEGTVPVFDQSDEGMLGYAAGDDCLRASPSRPVLYFGDHTCKLRIATQDFFVGPNTIPFVGDGIESLILFCALEGVQVHEEYKRHWQDLMKKRVILPDSKHQNELVEIFVGFLTLRMSLQAENRQLEIMRDTLLPELMSGRLRVKDAEKKIEEVM